jgi:hypothetical protein
MCFQRLNKPIISADEVYNKVMEMKPGDIERFYVSISDTIFDSDDKLNAFIENLTINLKHAVFCNYRSRKGYVLLEINVW